MKPKPHKKCPKESSIKKCWAESCHRCKRWKDLMAPGFNEAL